MVASESTWPLRIGISACHRAVFDDLGEALAAPLEQADDGRFATGPASAFSAHPARSKVAFVDLHFARKRPGLFQRQFHNPQTQQDRKAAACSAHSTQPAHPQCVQECPHKTTSRPSEKSPRKCARALRICFSLSFSMLCSSPPRKVAKTHLEYGICK